MRTPVCDLVGIEFPIFAFSHCRDVVAAVSRAGGMGILGAATHTTEELEIDVEWLDDQTQGGPYGVDLLFPATFDHRATEDLEMRVPDEHRRFVASLMQRFRIPPPKALVQGGDHSPLSPRRSMDKLDLVLSHDIRVIASGLGPLPREVAKKIHANGSLYAGMIGDPRHVARHAEADVDVLVAQGFEAGGHVGHISTFVLLPQVVEAAGGRPVLAAGGVATGRHVLAAIALGAQGVWTGSIWLTTKESDLEDAVVRKLLAARSTDAVISRAMSGKTSRQLRTPWIDAWEASDAPPTLPAPMQGMLVRAARQGMRDYGVEEVLGTAVGQVVGMMNSVRSSRDVVYGMVEEFIDAARELNTMTEASSGEAP